MSFDKIDNFRAPEHAGDTDNFDRLALLDPRNLRCSKDVPKADVSQKTIDSYLESFGNLYKNGACGPETHDAFKDVCKDLGDLNQKKVGAALNEAVLNKHVDVNLIVQHVKEILETEGFEKVDWKRGDTGKLSMKNKAGTTFEFTFELNKADREKSKSSLTIKKAE